MHPTSSLVELKLGWMDDGTEIEGGPGDTAVIPPGHDSWVIGDKPCILIDFTGMKDFAKKL